MSTSIKNRFDHSTLSRRKLLQGATASGAAAALATTLGGPSAIAAQDGTPAPEAQPGGTLTLSYSQETSYLHFMHLSSAAGSENVYNRAPVQAKLITRSTDLSEFIPDLAESWERSADGKRLTFHLRPGLTWHDGEPFSAADVDFTYHMIGVPGLGVYNTGTVFNGLVVGNQEWIDGTADRIEGLSTPDDVTVVFDFIDAFAEETIFRAFNQVCIAPRHVLEQYLDRERAADILQSDWATTASHVGIGPFRVTEYVADQHVVYEPFEQYYRGRPLVDQLIFRSFQDAQTNAAALENGEVDVARLAITEYERFQDFEHIELVTPQARTLQGTPFNTRQPYLTKQVRQALVHAIDRQAIIDALHAGIVDVVHCPVLGPNGEDSPNLVKYEYDPERAKALLEEGGWDSSRKIRWEVTEIPTDESFFAAVNGFWEAVGVQAEFHVVGRETEQMGPPDYNFDLYSSSYPIGTPLDIAAHYDPRLATYVSAGYETPEFVELWDKAKLQQSDEEYRQTIWRLQDIISEECLGLWIARTVDVWGVNRRVHEMHPKYLPGHYQFDWGLERVWVESEG